MFSARRQTPRTLTFFLHRLVRKRSIPSVRVLLCFFLLLVVLIYWLAPSLFASHGGLRAGGFVASIAPMRTLVSYSYFEKDAIQRDNFDFFLTEAMGINATDGEDRLVDYVLTLNGEKCTPCARFIDTMEEMEAVEDLEVVRGVTTILKRRNFWLLEKAENVGMDIAAHNSTLSLMQGLRVLRKYSYFIFLNSSVRGPFLPHYMPRGFHWTMAFTQRLSKQVKAVACSLTCLPERDSGGPGPRLESWAFAVDREGLSFITGASMFAVRNCKLGDDGVVVHGEYALTKSILEAGKSVATLLYKYAPDTDWKDPKNWNCNNNVHPSRHGTYDGVSMHPFETVFVKTSWHVGEPYADKYAKWRTMQRVSQNATAGDYDEWMYFYAISPLAQNANPLVHAAFTIQRPSK